VIELLPKTWQAFNPLDYETGNLTSEELVRLDLNLIFRSQAVLAKVLEPSWGCAIELRHARVMGVPVLGFDPPMARSPWLTAHVDKFFPTYVEAIAELDTVRLKDV